MENLVQAVKDFVTPERLKYLEKAKLLHKQFLELFPYESLKDLTIEQYALGLQPKDSFSWWLEYNTIPLGSIKGGSAAKHVIYYKKKEKAWFYPQEFLSEQEAWEKLRQDVIAIIDQVRSENYIEITEDNLLHNKSMLKGKISFMYAPNKLLPIYQVQHLKLFLSHLGVEENKMDSQDCVYLSMLLRDTLYAHQELQQFDEIILADFLYGTFMKKEVVTKIAPGDNANNWETCYENSFISIGWKELGDLSQYNTFNELKEQMSRLGYYPNASTITRKANEIWDFYNLQPGDIIIANRGTSKIIAIGTVNEEGYTYRPEFEHYQHTIGVTWDKVFDNGELSIPPQNKWKTITVGKVPKKQFDEWMRNGQVEKSEPIEEFEGDISFYEKMDKAIERKGQVILFGPPGTGKTYTVRQYIKWKQQQNIDLSVDFCTFHPSYQYEDFIEGYRPVQGDNGMVAFSLEDGVFKKFVKKAKENTEKMHIFIIDELNRGNVPKIFGELITLLEKDKRGMELTLPQSKESFAMPENIVLICTMNTSDRSIKMIDAAIKRRFAFIECMPDYDILNEDVDGLSVNSSDILKVLNNKLIAIQGRDSQIGHAYFMKGAKVVSTVEDIKDIFEFDLIPLLQEYCFDNYQLLAEIIGDSFVDLDEQDINRGIFTDSNEAFIEAIENHFLVNSHES